MKIKATDDRSRCFNSKQKLKVFDVHDSLWFSLWVTCLIVFGILLKTVIKINRNVIGKMSIITGIPFIRQRFFEIPMMMTVFSFVFSIYIFFSDKTIQSQHGRSLIKFLRKTNCSFFFSNWCFLICFFINYHQLILPISKLAGMKMSGHVLAITLSGNILINIKHFCDFIIASFPSYGKIVQYVVFVIRFLLYHSLYTLVWTAWVFHYSPDLILSLIISFLYIFLLKCCCIDYLCLSLIEPISQHKNHKNILWTNGQTQ